MIILNRNVKSIIVSVRTKSINLSYKRLYKKIYHCIGNLPLDTARLKSWRKKWSVLNTSFYDDSFHIFSSYVGERLDIVPMELCASTIEPLLNNFRYNPFFSDKNYFDLLIGPQSCPNTLLRKMDGVYYDAYYNRTRFSLHSFFELLEQKNIEGFVIKPSVGSQSGRGVMIFNKYQNKWINSKGDEFSDEIIINPKSDNLIIQERLIQNEKLNYFNPSSINTIRIATYRSVVDDKVHLLNAVLRIGGNGADVDNAHSGGIFCRIYEDGTLGKNVYDYLGNRFESFNGIDFSKSIYKVPYFNKVKELAIEVASKIVSQRLIAHDIAVDDKGEAKLIEFNCHSFSCWFFQFTSGGAFGEYTDEIINYCSSHKDGRYIGYANWRFLR